MRARDMRISGPKFAYSVRTKFRRRERSEHENGPGGIADVFGRITADRLTKVLGKPLIVESRSGAGGAIGTEYVVRSPPDGHTLYFAGGGHSPLFR
jgi:hypothetical protein